MIPRNEEQAKKVPSLVQYWIDEVNLLLPGQGEALYWRAFDRWDKNGRESWNKSVKPEPQDPKENPNSVLELLS